MNKVKIGKSSFDVRPKEDLSWGEWIDVGELYDNVSKADSAFSAFNDIFTLVKIIVPSLEKEHLYDVKAEKMQEVVTQAMVACVDTEEDDSPEEEDESGKKA